MNKKYLLHKPLMICWIFCISVVGLVATIKAIHTGQLFYILLYIFIIPVSYFLSLFEKESDDCYTMQDVKNFFKLTEKD